MLGLWHESPNMTYPKSAVILAAGIGERLKAVLPDRPKGFIELAGSPIIERSIHQLRRIGITEIVIVTGYRSEYYKALALRHPEICLIENEEYANSGSMYSLYCAQEYVRDSFFLLESDLVYEDRALTALVNFPRLNGILTSGFTYSTDEVYVGTNGERIVRLSKQRAELQDVVGELVGISKISLDVYEAMIHHAEERFQQNPLMCYEDGVNGVAQGVPVYYCKVDDLIWAEIDTPFHLERVRQKIMPQLDGM